MHITENHLGISKCFAFETNLPGPTVTVFSGIHGDETSGIRALSRFYSELLDRTKCLVRWRLILVLGANEQAIKQNTRYVSHNLNRLFRDDLTDEWYEYERSRELMQILRESDYLLDLHSTSGPSIPFLFTETPDIDLARKLGASHVISGWSELNSDATAGDTECYINAHGGAGFTFEAGNHDSPEWESHAYQMILNFLTTLEAIKGNHFREIGTPEKLVINMTSVYVAKTNRFTFRLDSLENFTPISAWTLIAHDGDEEIRAEKDFILVMPKLSEIRPGEDVFFVGEKLR